MTATLTSSDQVRPPAPLPGAGRRSRRERLGLGVLLFGTAALYLVIVLAALTTSPAVALAIGALFGLVRGLAVLLGRGITSADTLAAFHRRFTELGSVVLGMVVAGELACAVAFVAFVSFWAALALALVLLVGGATAAARRARRRSPVPARS